MIDTGFAVTKCFLFLCDHYLHPGLSHADAGCDCYHAGLSHADPGRGRYLAGLSHENTGCDHYLAGLLNADPEYLAYYTLTLSALPRTPPQ